MLNITPTVSQLKDRLLRNVIVSLESKHQELYSVVLQFIQNVTIHINIAQIHINEHIIMV